MISNCEPLFSACLRGVNARFAQTDAVVPPTPPFATGDIGIFVSADGHVRGSGAIAAVAGGTVAVQME